VIARNVLGRALALTSSFALSQAVVHVAASSSHVVDPGQVVNRLLDHAAFTRAWIRIWPVGKPAIRTAPTSSRLPPGRGRRPPPGKRR
jgi:hypothetical protein